MFSRRVPTGLTENRLTRAVATRRAAGRPILDLTVSNPTTVGLVGHAQTVLAPLFDPRSLRYDPAPQGTLDARRAVAGEFHRLGSPVDPVQLVLTASTSEAYGYLLQLLCDPGDRVLVPRPSYPLFEHLCRLEAVEPVPYELVYLDGWRVDLESVASGLEAGCRALIAVSPNNPTGSYLWSDEIASLEDLLAGAGAALICDEVFADYPFGDEAPWPRSVAGRERVLTFALGGLSKSVGLPQMKLGWIAVSGPAALQEQALDRLVWIADSKLSVSTPAQLALPHWLADGASMREAIRRRVVGNRQALQAARGPDDPWDVLRADGGWYAVLRVPRLRSDEEWALALLDQGVLLHPGWFYDFDDEGRLVLSLLPEPATFAQAIELLRQVVR